MRPSQPRVRPRYATSLTRFGNTRWSSLAWPLELPKMTLLISSPEESTATPCGKTLLARRCGACWPSAAIRRRLPTEKKLWPTVSRWRDSFRQLTTDRWLSINHGFAQAAVARAKPRLYGGNDGSAGAHFSSYPEDSGDDS